MAAGKKPNLKPRKALRPASDPRATWQPVANALPPSMHAWTPRAFHKQILRLLHATVLLLEHVVVSRGALFPPLQNENLGSGGV